MSRRSCTPRSPLKTPILWTVRAGRCPKASLKSAAFLDGEGQILVWTHFLTHIPVIPVINNHSFTKVKTCVFLAGVVQVPKGMALIVLRFLIKCTERLVCAVALAGSHQESCFTSHGQTHTVPLLCGSVFVHVGVSICSYVIDKSCDLYIIVVHVLNCAFPLTHALFLLYYYEQTRARAHTHCLGCIQKIKKN